MTDPCAIHVPFNSQNRRQDAYLTVTHYLKVSKNGGIPRRLGRDGIRDYHQEKRPRKGLLKLLNWRSKFGCGGRI